MIRVSTGMKQRVMAELGAMNALQYGIIDIYTGSQPASANDAPTGQHIARVTQGGMSFTPGSIAGGLVMTPDSGGELRRHGQWVLKGLDTGTAGWFRWKPNQNDPNDANASRVRIDGAVGRELVLDDPEITPTTEVTIQGVRLYLDNF